MAKKDSSPLPVERELHERLGPGNYKPIARATGLSPSHVSRVLRGLANPTTDILSQIAEAADVPVGMLMTLIQSKRKAS